MSRVEISSPNTADKSNTILNKNLIAVKRDHLTLMSQCPDGKENAYFP